MLHSNVRLLAIASEALGAEGLDSYFPGLEIEANLAEMILSDWLAENPGAWNPAGEDHGCTIEPDLLELRSKAIEAGAVAETVPTGRAMRAPHYTCGPPHAPNEVALSCGGLLWLIEADKFLRLTLDAIARECAAVPNPPCIVAGIDPATFFAMHHRQRETQRIEKVLGPWLYAGMVWIAPRALQLSAAAWARSPGAFEPAPGGFLGEPRPPE